MKQGRETNLKERVEITRECIQNGLNYGETAKKYNISYRQVYTWVRKYRESGEAGLEDRRGKHGAAGVSEDVNALKRRIAELEESLSRAEEEIAGLKEKYEK